jgi:hypothetical protein
MTDVSLFLRLGWKHIWKQNNIFFFSSLTIITQFLYFFSRGQEFNPILGLLFSIAGLILSFINLIGVPYMAYRFLIGDPAGNRETLTAVKAFWSRLIGCSALVLLIISPILLVIFFMARMFSSTPEETRTLYNVIIMLFLLPFGSLLDFGLFGFFHNNDGIGESLKKAWSLFVSHFWTLTILSLILIILIRGANFLAAMLTLLLQNHFDITSLSQINFLNPGVLPSNNPLYLLLSGIGTMILSPFSDLVYGSAYLKYTDVEKLS